MPMGDSSVSPAGDFNEADVTFVQGMIPVTSRALVLAIIGIHASRLLHDAVPSAVRAGVSSGVGTLTCCRRLR